MWALLLAAMFVQTFSYVVTCFVYTFSKLCDGCIPGVDQLRDVSTQYMTVMWIIPVAGLDIMPVAEAPVDNTWLLFITRLRESLKPAIGNGIQLQTANGPINLASASVPGLLYLNDVRRPHHKT